MSDSFVPATEHGEFDQAFDDIFVVQGSMHFSGHRMVITRNMTVVRQGDELTIINSVRLNDEGLAALEGLGTVKHLVKLSDFHGIDDPFYKDRYDPTVWALAGAKHKRDLTSDREYDEESEFPIKNASVFVFKNTRTPEAALVLPRDGGILITADCVQNIVDKTGCKGVDSFFTKENGFLRPAGIGIGWRRGVAKDGGPPLVPDYQRLMQREFAHLISGHGPVLRDTTKTDLRATIRTIWGVSL